MLFTRHRAAAISLNNICGWAISRKGSYSGHEIELTYPIFHVAGLSSRGSFIIDNKA